MPLVYSLHLGLLTVYIFGFHLLVTVTVKVLGLLTVYVFGLCGSYLNHTFLLSVLSEDELSDPIEGILFPIKGYKVRVACTLCCYEEQKHSIFTFG